MERRLFCVKRGCKGEWSNCGLLEDGGQGYPMTAAKLPDSRPLASSSLACNGDIEGKEKDNQTKQRHGDTDSPTCDACVYEKRKTNVALPRRAS